MATGSRTTFQKRQKEMARMEKQRMKAERRAQKKETGGGGPPIDYEATTALSTSEMKELGLIEEEKLTVEP